MSVVATYDYTNLDYTQVAITNYVTNLKQSVVLGNQFTKSGFNNIWDVKVSSPNKKLDFQTTTGNSGRDVEIKFTEPIIGKGNSFSYTVSFKTNESLENNGLIKEIYIPKVEKLPEFKDYKTNILYPREFGEVSFASPALYTIDESKNTLTFANESCYTVAQVVFFGNYQIYNFDLTYDLENTTPFAQNKIITLPPNILGRQEVIVKQISPAPKNTYVDLDGNTQAVIALSSKSTLTVRAFGLIKVINEPLNGKKPRQLQALTNDKIGSYTKPLPFWEVDNADIKAIAKKLITPKNIYNFVVKTISYDTNKQSQGNSSRYGAVKTLATKSGVCMEFTDLTIALLRAGGIPAREIDGFAYSKDLTKKPLSVFYNLEDDFLHSWVEFYDPVYGWIPIDPTWEATSGLDYFNNFDSNHVSLVIKGTDSTNPLPPGYYRNKNDLTKKVNISFASYAKWNPNESVVKDISVKSNFGITEILGIFGVACLCGSLGILIFHLLSPRK